MNYKAFYDEIESAFPSITNGDKGTINDLYNVFTLNHYSMSEFVKLIKEFFDRLKKYDWDEDELFRVLHNYINAYQVVEFDEEAFEDLGLEHDDADEIDDSTGISGLEYLEQLTRDELRKGNDTGDLVDLPDYYEFIRKVLDEIGVDDDDYTDDELDTLVDDYVSKYPDGSAPTDDEAIHDYIDKYGDMLDDLFGIEEDGEESELEVDYTDIEDPDDPIVPSPEFMEGFNGEFNSSEDFITGYSQSGDGDPIYSINTELIKTANPSLYQQLIDQGVIDNDSLTNDGLLALYLMMLYNDIVSADGKTYTMDANEEYFSTLRTIVLQIDEYGVMYVVEHLGDEDTYYGGAFDGMKTTTFVEALNSYANEHGNELLMNTLTTYAMIDDIFSQLNPNYTANEVMDFIEGFDNVSDLISNTNSDDVVQYYRDNNYKEDEEGNWVQVEDSEETDEPEDTVEQTVQDPVNLLSNSQVTASSSSIDGKTVFLDFLGAIEDGKVYYDQQLFKTYFPTLYEALDNAGLLTVESGAISYRGGQTSVAGVYLDDKIADIFLQAYMDELYNTYLKDATGEELADLQNQLGDTDNKSLLLVIKQFYDQGEQQALYPLVTSDEYATKFKSIFNMLDEQGSNEGLDNYFTQIYNLSEAFFQVNPDYTVEQLFGFISSDESAFEDGSYTAEDIVGYYADNGQTFDVPEEEEQTDQDKIDDALSDAVKDLHNDDDVDVNDDDEGQDPSQTAEDLANMLKEDDVDVNDDDEGQDPSRTADDLANRLKEDDEVDIDTEDMDADDPTETGENSRQLEEMTVEEAIEYAKENDDVEMYALLVESAGKYYDIILTRGDKAYVVDEFVQRADWFWLDFGDDTINEVASVDEYDWADNYQSVKDDDTTNTIDNLKTEEELMDEIYGDNPQPPLEDMTQTQPTIAEVDDDGNVTTVEEVKDLIGDNPQPPLDDMTQSQKYLYAEGYYGILMDDGTYLIMEVDENLKASVVESDLSVSKYDKMVDSLGNVTEMTAQDWDDMTSSSSDATDDDEQNEIDYESTDYDTFVDKMTDHMGDMLELEKIQDDGQSSVDQLLRDLYPIYLDNSDDYNYNQFANQLDSIASQLSNYAYDNSGYEFGSQKDLNDAVLDYITNYGLVDVDESSLSYNDDGSVNIVESSNDRQLSEKDGEIFAIVNDDGTYKIIQVNDDGDAEVYDPGLTQEEYDDLKEDVDMRTGKPDDVADEDWYEQIYPPDTTDEKDDEEQQHPMDKIMNDSINILQQTDNYGPININTTPVLPNPFYQDKYDEINAPTFAEANYYTEDGIDVLRLSDYTTRMTVEEWEYIKESFDYDRDITKPFMIQQGDNTFPKEYSIKYINAWEYYYELGQTRDFYRWLDARKAGTESRSFIYYMMERQAKPSNRDKDYYDQLGYVAKALPGVEFLDQSRSYNKNDTKQEINETFELGINNISAFILSSAVCTMFCTMMMENIKKIADVPVISRFEVTEEGDVKGLDDAVMSGMYEKGSKIRDAIENAQGLNRVQKDILRIIFKKRSFATLKDLRIANRYGDIVFNFFGKQDSRQHQLENNTGLVIFNIGLILLGYYNSYMDSNTTMGIDTNVKSNLLKIISNALEVLYPSKKYDSELIRQIENIVSEFERDIKAKHRGENTVDNLADIMLEPVSNMVHRAFFETHTTFRIDQFFDENTMNHLTTNFGLEAYMRVKSPQSLVDFILDGFVSANEFNNMVKRMMVTTLGESFTFNANAMFDVLFFSKPQANAMLLNPKYNLIIPLIHIETIDLIPEDKVDVTMIGFQSRIVGLVEYEKKQGSVYRQAVEDDVNEVVPFYEDEQNISFLEEADAKERVAKINEQVGEQILTDVHRNDSGLYVIGENEDQAKEFYNRTNPPEVKALQNMPTRNVDDEEDEEFKDLYRHQVMSEYEDYEEIPDSLDIKDEVQDWQIAGLLEFVNQNPGMERAEYENKLKDLVANWKSNEVKVVVEESSYRDYTIVKNEDSNQLFILFRGSQSNWMGDWFSNLWTGTSPLGYAYNVFPSSIVGNHAGFTNTYNGYKEKFMDDVRMLANQQTKIIISGHSRGGALSNLAVEDILNSGLPKENIKYRAFGNPNLRTKQSADEFNKLIEGVDYKTYHVSGDPLRLLNIYGPYHKTGKDYLIMAHESDPNYNPFASIELNVLDGIKEDDEKLSGFWKYMRSRINENHFTGTYKNLLFQDSHNLKYKKKNDPTFFTIQNLGVSGGVLSSIFLGATSWVLWKRNKRMRMSASTALTQLADVQKQAEQQQAQIHEHEHILHNRLLDSELRHRQESIDRPLTEQEQQEAFNSAVQRFREVRQEIRGERPVDVMKTPLPNKPGLGFTSTPQSDAPPPDPDFYGLDDPSIEVEDIPPVQGSLDQFQERFGA